VNTAMPVARQWEVNGLRLAGLCWGNERLPPVLALHGWLDNAASFERLAPLLERHHVVALDLTGHGQSSWRSADASYQIWDDLPELMAVLAQLGWAQFDLLGHSRGAIISAILASTMPERIGHLVLLDAMFAPTIPEHDFPQQMAKFLQDKPRLLKHRGRFYSTERKAVAARTKNGLSEHAARALACRGLHEQDGGFIWNSDPRLHGASAVKLTQGQNQAIAQNLTMPTLILLAEDGLSRSSASPANLNRYGANVHTEIMPGGHHFHMEDGAAKVAARIARFLAI